MEWCKWVYNETEYEFRGDPHWEFPSKKGSFAAKFEVKLLMANVRLQ